MLLMKVCLSMSKVMVSGLRLFQEGMARDVSAQIFSNDGSLVHDSQYASRPVGRISAEVR